MNAEYSLLTLRPDPERVDVVCVGALVRDHASRWHVVMPPAAADKVRAVGGSSAEPLDQLSNNLSRVLERCTGMPAARELIERIGGRLSLHGFQGVFSYESDASFHGQLEAISRESILVSVPHPPARVARKRVGRPHTRARLRQHFEHMGILAKDASELGEHKVVRNFPVSTEHDLIAEFALRNSVMHITETVDFEVSDDSLRNKRFEAQAKCLVLRAARENFGAKTECYVVLSGAGQPHAARAVDLLSTVGRLYATENQDDMAEYLDRIAHAARTTGQVGRADGTSRFHEQDRARISVNEDYELRDWSRKFGVTPDQLKAAVKKVGDQIDAVERELKGKK